MNPFLKVIPCIYSLLYCAMKVERDGELVLVREVVVEVTEEAEVEHEAHYVLTKFGSQEVKLDCTDFTENSHNWTRAGQADRN